MIKVEEVDIKFATEEPSVRYDSWSRVDNRSFFLQFRNPPKENLSVHRYERLGQLVGRLICYSKLFFFLRLKTSFIQGYYFFSSEDAFMQLTIYLNTLPLYLNIEF